MKTLVLNASQHLNGRSSELAARFLNQQPYQQVNLVDYRIDQLGQVSNDDQLALVINELKSADQLVITTPIYWSDMPGCLKTFIDRSGNPSDNKFSGIECFLLIQGFAPADAIEPVTHVVDHWATRDAMKFIGTATNDDEIRQLRKYL